MTSAGDNTAALPADGSNRERERYEALQAALILRQGRQSSAQELTSDASTIFWWLAGPVVMWFETPAIVRDQQTGEPTGATIGGAMTQMRDGDKCTLILREKDAKGAEILDDPNLSWTSSDTSVATIVDSTEADVPKGAKDIIGGLPGSAVVTAASGQITITQAFDVVPGDVALMSFDVGTPKPQDAAPATGTAAPAAPADHGAGPGPVTDPAAPAAPAGP